MRNKDLEQSGSKPRSNLYSSDHDYDEAEEHWKPWLVPVLVVLNVVLFVIVMYVNDCPKHVRRNGFVDGKCVGRFLGRLSFEPLSENPLFGPSSNTLAKMGALDRSRILYDHQSWRLITNIWFHAGLIHLLVNMLSLVFIGIRLEQQFGFVRIGAIYILSGFGGSVLSSLFTQNNIMVGASGALFGLLGAMLSELITNCTIYTNKVAALLTLLFVVLLNLAVGTLPHVDNFAHIGGFLAGFFLGFVLLPRPHFGWFESGQGGRNVGVSSKYKTYQIVLWAVSLCLLIAGFVVGLLMLFRGVNGYQHCHWCRYLTCIPTSKWKCNM
ncbi:hypothetical protein Droror1_Dr00002648 [Drosera rotundifolia]